MTRKKVAVIGLGNRGRFFVTALKEKKQEIELVAASDCSNERLLKTCDSYAIPAAYDDWREMLDKEELDAVVVSTPDFTHCEIVLEAFKHGNHVLVEKPMALTSTECRKMIEAADASNCFLMVGFVLRYNQFYLELKKAVDSGEIGKLVSANVIDSVSPGGRYFFHNWMRLKKHTGGLLLQKATHSVDIANWIIGGTPLEVFATGALDYFGGKESNTKRCCTCDKKTSCPDFLHKSDSHLDYENGNGYQVEKEDYCAFAKEIDIEDNEQFLAKYDNNVRLQFSGYYFTPDYKREFTFYGTGGRISAVEHYSPGEPFCKIALEKRNGESKIFSPKHLPGGHGGGDPEMINDFVHCLFSGEKPVADGLCGLNSVSLCEAAQKSITTGLIQKSQALKMIMNNSNSILKESTSLMESILPEIVKIRHDLHQYPERRFNEIRTSNIIEQELQACGCKTNRITETGVIGMLEGVQPGKNVALRADIDALPIKETTGKEYASVNEFMHACGHDGHTAILLGVAKVLAQMRERINGTVKFIFQPAEEGGLGAKIMCEQGALTNPDVDAVFGLHAWPDLQCGTIGIRKGQMLASQNRFSIVVKGKGAHGARPQEAVDSILIAARIVDALQAVVSRMTSPLNPAVVTIGSIHGGTAGNIIPEKVEMRGTIRNFDNETQNFIMASIEQIATHTAKSLGGEAEVTFDPGVPPTVNSPQMTDIVIRVAQNILESESVIEVERVMGAEDFAFYLQEIPGAFFFLGLAEKGQKPAPVHNSNFDFNDNAISVGIKMMIGTVFEYLDK